MNYPVELKRREAAAIEFRRKKAGAVPVSPAEPAPGVENAPPGGQSDPLEGSSAEPKPDGRKNPPGSERDQLPPRTVGLALSGGGIRSATFSLGVLQALASKRRLRHVDFMSTVSGGGYTGSFLGRLFTRPAIAELAEAKNGDPCGRVEEIVGNCASPQLEWLREHGNYILSEGSSDLREELALFWRNLTTIYFILLCLAVVLFGVLRVAGDFLPAALSAPAFAFAVGPEFAASLSPWWWLPLAVFGFAVVPSGIGYWLAPKQDTHAAFSFYPTASWMVLLVCLAVAAGVPDGLEVALPGMIAVLLGVLYLEAARLGLPPRLDPSTGETSADAGTVIRNRLSRSMGEILVLFAASALWVVVDTLGRAFARNDLHPYVTAFLAVMTPLTPFLRKLATVLGKPDAKKSSDDSTPGLFASPALRAAIIAFPIAGFVLVLFDGVVHWLFNHHSSLGLFSFVASLAISIVLGRAYDFLNYSALQQAYGTRLARTFLGASNPARFRAAAEEYGNDVQLSHPDDDITFAQYHPEANGGPVHLIGLCINETIDAASQREIRDRKGLTMCVGPCGVNVGRKFHALWTAPPPADKVRWSVRLRRLLDGRLPPPDGQKTALRAIPIPGEIFHVLQGKRNEPVVVEPLRLGTWIATSGAAFGTGTGRTTSLPMALLLGLVNLRLGYWWDSGLSARERAGRFPTNLWRRIKGTPGWLLKMQSLLLSDFVGRFQGPGYRFWNISDGGHFDGTGVYELLRRRVPFIIAVDGTEDPQLGFEDMAALVSQARIDFGAQVRFVDPAVDFQSVPRWIRDWMSPLGPALGKLKDIGTPGGAHAALAAVTYAGDTQPETWLLVLKASLTGDESLDIESYKRTHQDFPGEPTTEQFFNEAQWESYRALGQHVGEKLLR